MRFFEARISAPSGSIGREFLQAQIEVATEPHCDAGDGAQELLRLRQSAAAAAAEHGLAILASGTHPMAAGGMPSRARKIATQKVMDDLQMIGQRNMLCGMHVHVEFPDPGAARRCDDADAALPAAVHRAVDVVAILAGPRHRAEGLPPRGL